MESVDLPVHQFIAMTEPITRNQVQQYIAQEPNHEEAIKYLASLRDERAVRMSMLYEQVSRGMDFLKLQLAFGLYKDTYYEREVNSWAVKMSRVYQTLADEHAALQAGIDQLSSA
jgi:hypothetical protein